MIGRARESDLATLLDIERLCFGVDAWSQTLVRAELDAPARLVLVERDGNSAVVGYASVLVAGDLADLPRIAVRPEYRNRGYGRRLLDEATVSAATGGAERMLLEVAADNGPAVALYGSSGFCEIDRRAGCYGPGRDVLVLAKPLRPV